MDKLELKLTQEKAEAFDRFRKMLQHAKEQNVTFSTLNKEQAQLIDALFGHLRLYEQNKACQTHCHYNNVIKPSFDSTTAILEKDYKNLMIRTKHFLPNAEELITEIDKQDELLKSLFAPGE